jgi:hypothetical protein
MSESATATAAAKSTATAAFAAEAAAIATATAETERISGTSLCACVIKRSGTLIRSEHMATCVADAVLQ